jgi:hypothetical protein
MSFHTKARRAFFAFHIVITAGWLLLHKIFETTPDAWGVPRMRTEILAPVWIIFCLFVSLAGLALAYLVRAVVKLFRRRSKLPAP